MIRFTLVVISLLTLLGNLTGCAAPSTPMMGPGHTATYAAGYSDGCSSGNASQNPVAGFYRKDGKRFDSEPQYAAGWKAGYQKCEAAQIELLMRSR